MRPAILVFVETEESSGASSEVFLERFEACSAYYWSLFNAFEACLGSNDLKLVCCHGRGIYHRPNSFRILSCDGPDRLIRPLSHDSWQVWFRAWGFTEAPILPHVLTALLQVLRGFPGDFQTSLINTTLWLAYKGRAMAHATCWV